MSSTWFVEGVRSNFRSGLDLLSGGAYSTHQYERPKMMSVTPSFGDGSLTVSDVVHFGEGVACQVFETDCYELVNMIQFP